MSLIDDLLAQARILAKIDENGRSRAGAGRPRQADLRRAVSTAYYAVFHAIAERAVEEVLGAGDVKSAWGYRLRRTISHATVLKVAKWFIKGKKSENMSGSIREFRHSLSLTAIDQGFSGLCSDIKELQEERHRADYDLGEPFTKKDTQRLIQAAVDAVAMIRELESKGDVRLFFLACIVDITKNA